MRMGKNEMGSTLSRLNSTALSELSHSWKARHGLREEEKEDSGANIQVRTFWGSVKTVLSRSPSRTPTISQFLGNSVRENNMTCSGLPLLLLNSSTLPTISVNCEIELENVLVYYVYVFLALSISQC